MYEEYTDKQIIEMLKPKLEKLGWEPEFGPRMEKLVGTLYKSGYIRGQLGRSFIIGERKDKSVSGKTERWIFATQVNTKKGDKVKMIDKDAHNSDPMRFPAVGTVGTVIGHDCYDVYVQWPKGTTSGNDRWYAYYNRFEVFVCE